MIKYKGIKLTGMLFAICALLCSAADKGDEGKKEPIFSAPTPGIFFSTNLPSGQQKPSPFSAKISADFVKKVMETSARIEKCKKQISNRQAYLYESNPQIKAYRQQMIEMQGRINKILKSDKELIDMRLNRDIIWTTMPVLPKMRYQQPGMRPRILGTK